MRDGGRRLDPGVAVSRRRLLAQLAACGLAATAGRAAAGVAGAPANREDIIGRLRTHITRPDSILLDVARRFDLGIVEISAANPGIDPWMPGPERLVVLPTAHILPDAPREGIVINLAELRLYYFGAGGVETHAIGIGRDGFHTPKGRTRIVRKAKNPTWYPTESKRKLDPTVPRVVPPGPDNPLGHRALYLGWPAYLIHGTNKPYGVGRRVSLGCIRMYPEQIEDLYEKVEVGTPVTVVAQWVKCGFRDGELWLEVHPDYDQVDELEVHYTMTAKPPPAGSLDYIRQIAGDEAARVDWDFVEAELVARRGYPVRITRRPGEVALGLPELDRSTGAGPSHTDVAGTSSLY